VPLGADRGRQTFGQHRQAPPAGEEQRTQATEVSKPRQKSERACKNWHRQPNWSTAANGMNISFKPEDQHIEIDQLKLRLFKALHTFTVEELRQLVAEIEEQLRQKNDGKPN
jgi:hypothetical protein